MGAGGPLCGFGDHETATTLSENPTVASLWRNSEDVSRGHVSGSTAHRHLHRSLEGYRDDLLRMTVIGNQDFRPEDQISELEPPHRKRPDVNSFFYLFRRQGIEGGNFLWNREQELTGGQKTSLSL